MYRCKSNREPAWKQTYHRFDLRELTAKRPE